MATLQVQPIHARLLSVFLIALVPLRFTEASNKTLVRCDFETGLQGWKKWSTVEMTQTVRGDNVHSGKGALWGEVKERGPLVHSLSGLDFSIAGARLSFWYFVPKQATFDWFEINVRTHEYGDQMFQLSRGIRKGVWTRMELPFSEFFGWSFRAFGSLRIKEFEITSVGVGGIGLDDVAITVDEKAAAEVARVPYVLYLPGRDATSAPGGTWSYFRKRFMVQKLPTCAGLQLSGDDEAEVWVNGKDLGRAGLSPATDFNLKPTLRTGENVIAVAVLNHGQSPNPSGFAAVIGMGSARLDEIVLISDASWSSSAEAPEGWTRPDFDDSRWQPAQKVCKVSGPPWGIVDIYPLRQMRDFAIPEVRVEVRKAALQILLQPAASTRDQFDYIVHVNRMKSDLSRSQIAMRRGRVTVAGAVVPIELAPVEGLQDAIEVQVAFPGKGARATKILWLPERPVERCDRASATRVKGAGFFQTAQVGDRWFLIDPEGNLFHSLACNAIISAAYWSQAYHDHVNETYVDRSAWAEFACRRLFDLGFNSLSYGDDAIEPHRRRNMPYFSGVNVTWAGPRLQNARGETAFFPDVFDPAWQKGADEWIRKTTELYRNDPLLVAYFTDNEIQCHQPLSRTEGVMDYFWSPATSRELTRWLSERYQGNINTLNRHWSSRYHTYSYGAFDDLPKDKPALRGDGDPVAEDLRDFVRHIIKTYVETVVGFYRKYDPNHLVCSNRFAGQFDVSFADLLKPYDVIACNSYPRSRWGQVSFDEGQLHWLRALHQITGRPLLVTEWGVMATDTHLPNFWGRLDAQRQRAQAYRKVLRQFWDEKYIIGSHWFSWVDSTDAEEVNTGIVEAEDRFYQPLATVMREVNAAFKRKVREWRAGAE